MPVAATQHAADEIDEQRGKTMHRLSFLVDLRHIILRVQQIHTIILRTLPNAQLQVSHIPQHQALSFFP